MDHPAPRLREVDGLRVYEHTPADRGPMLVVELRTDVGESHEPPHLHGVGQLLLAAAAAAAERPGVDVRSAVTLERSALRLEGEPTVVADALADAIAELASPTTDHLAAARRKLVGFAPVVTPASFARSRRFGTVGYGLTPFSLYALERAGDDDVRAWARHWHAGTTHVTAVGEVPDFVQRLPTDGPTPQPASLTNARILPGTTDWRTPGIGLSWLAGSLPEDRAAAVVVVDRLRARLPRGMRIDSDVEQLQPGTQHVLVLVVISDDDDADELATAAVGVFDELASEGPTVDELVRASAGTSTIPDAAAVAAAAGRARDELLVLLPGPPRSLGDLTVATPAEPPRLDGDRIARLRSALWTKDRRSRLDLHTDGVRLDREDVRIVAPRPDIIALLRHRDGTRTLVRRDDVAFMVDSALWRDGRRAVEHVDHCFAEVAVDVPPSGPPPSALVKAAHSSRWVVAVIGTVLLVPLALLLMIAAFDAPMPQRLLLVALPALFAGGLAWISLTFARERFAARSALLDREAAAGSSPDP